MKISNTAIQILSETILNCPYRSGPQLIDFFYEYGATEVYDSTFGTRKNYVLGKLNEYNNTDKMKDVVEDSLYPSHFSNEEEQIKKAKELGLAIRKDGYKLITEKVEEIVEEEFLIECFVFKVVPIGVQTIQCQKIKKLDHNFIQEQIKKSQYKLDKGDYDGVITNTRSLVESIQEEIINKSGEKIPEYDGDLIKLYKVTKKVLNLDPAQKKLSEILKQILSGLITSINGLSGLSNKMGDRHARRYKPEKHHAKLMINSAFTFCEFLLDTYEYQKSKNKKSESKR